jgi:O-antigen ligase
MTLYLMKGPSGYGATGASYSATSIAVLVMGLGIFFTLRHFKARLAQLGRWAAMALVGYAVVAVAMNMLGTSLISVVAPVLGRDATLTNRTDVIWDVLLPIAWQHPVLGLGYGSFWIKPVPNLTYAANEAHNGYLDVFLEQGVVGLILVALVAVMYFRKARNEFPDNFHWAAFRMSYLVMFLFHNWTEATLLRSTELLWNIFVLFTVVYPKEWTGRVDDRLIPVEEEALSPVAAAPTASPARETISALDSGMANALGLQDES